MAQDSSQSGAARQESRPPLPMRPAAARWAAFFALVSIALVAVVVRAYRLDEQSASWDDYNGLAGLSVPGFVSSLTAALKANDETPPMYYLVQYAWARCLGSDPVTVRWLSIVLGLLTIPLIYLIGREAFGRTAGCVAALCFALSPVHVWHDQSVRLYPLLVLLAAASFYSLLRATHGGGRRWWWLNVLCNALIIWTHIFGVFLAVTEGCYLLAFFLRRPRQVILWAFAHLVPIVPMAIAVILMPHLPAFAFAHFSPPDLRGFFFDWVGDDAIGQGYQMVIASTTWPFITGQWLARFVGYHRTGDYALAFVFLACLLWLVARIVLAVYARPRRAPQSAGDGGKSDLESLVLLLAVSTVPLLIFTVLSFTWRPCMYPRYTMYSSLALYVILGGVVQHIRWAVVRVGVVALVALLYVYQLSFMLPAVTRTNWCGAARLIRESASPNDLILIGGYAPAYPNLNIFCLNMGPTDLPIAAAHSLQAVCDKTVCFFQHYPPPVAEERPQSVWFVINIVYQKVSLLNLDECLAARGLRFERYNLLGEEHLAMLRIQRGPDFETASRKPAPLVKCAIDYDQVLDEAGLTFPNADARARAIALVRRTYDDGDFPPGIKPMDWMEGLLCEEGAYDLALQAVHKAIERSPDSSKLAMALLDAGEIDAALDEATRTLSINPADLRACLARVFALLLQHDGAQVQETLHAAAPYHGGLILRYEPFVAAYSRGDKDVARAEAFRLRCWASTVPLPPCMLAELGLQLWCTPCTPEDVHPLLK